MGLGLAELFKRANALPKYPELGAHYAEPSGERQMNIFSDVIPTASWFLMPKTLGVNAIGALGSEIAGNELIRKQRLRQVGRQGYNMGYTNPFLG